jgi:UDP-N-acetylmuramyl tripeptide synthase
MKSKSMFISLIPWVLFTLIAGKVDSSLVGWAAVVAGAAVVAIVIRARRETTMNGARPALKIIDVTAVITFTATAALAFTGSHDLREHLYQYPG